MGATQQRALWICTGMLLIVAVMSILALDDDVLYIDENTSIRHLGGLQEQYTLQQTSASIAMGSQQHAPGYFWLLNGWARLVGYAFAALRYVGALFGFISLAAVYRFARDNYGLETALFALSILSASALNIYYFHEIRMYSLLTMWIVIVLWQYGRIIRKGYHPTRLDYAFMLGSVSALLYSHYFSFFSLVGIGLYHLFLVRKDRRWWWVTLTFFAAGITFLPWLGTTLEGTNELAAANQLNFGGIPDVFVNGLYLFGNGWALLSGLSLLGLWSAIRNYRVVSLTLIVCITVIGCLIVGQVLLSFLPIHRSRYFLILFPFLAILVGYGFAQWTRWRALWVTAIVLWFVAGFQFAHSPQFTAYTNRATFNTAQMPPLHPIVNAFFRTNAVRTPEDYLFVANQVETGGALETVTDKYWRQLNINGALMRHRMFINNPDKTWLAEYDLSDTPPMVIFFGFDPDRVPEAEYEIVVGTLPPDYQACAPLADDATVFVGVFVQAPAPCSIVDAPSLNLDFVEQPIRLARHDHSLSDSQLAVITTWASMGERADRFSFSIRLVNAHGEVVAAVDQAVPQAVSSFGTPDGAMRRALTSFDTSAWEAGTYTMEAIVYDWQTLEPLTPTRPTQPDAPFIVTLGQVAIP